VELNFVFSRHIVFKCEDVHRINLVQKGPSGVNTLMNLWFL
jgi:hypothetical protein